VPDGRKPAGLAVNGKSADFKLVNGYALVERTWRAGDAVSLTLDMPVERLYAHPAVKMDIGRVCLKRGPLVYCMEGADNPNIAPALARLPRDGAIMPAENSDLFGGIVQLVAEGSAAATTGWDGALYRPTPPGWAPAELTLVPYYIWDNREPGEMMVWLAEC
jgi:DUF1680 family protein